jgi:hypothetical protein
LPPLASDLLGRERQVAIPVDDCAVLIMVCNEPSIPKPPSNPLSGNQDTDSFSHAEIRVEGRLLVLLAQSLPLRRVNEPLSNRVFLG